MILPNQQFTLLVTENGPGSRKLSIFGRLRSQKGILSRFRTDSQVVENADEQPPPTYEAALKMMSDDLSLGSVPSTPICWSESRGITEHRILHYPKK